MPGTLPLTFFAIPFPDPLNTNETLPETLWWPQLIAIDGSGMTAHVAFFGYRDLAAVLAWWQDHTTAQSIGVKDYTLGGAEFLQTYAAVFAGQVGLSDAVFALTQKKDVDTGEKDESGQAIMRSFFVGATRQVVDVPLTTT